MPLTSMGFAGKISENRYPEPLKERLQSMNSDSRSLSPLAMIVFPGSNCDEDCSSVISDVFGMTVQKVWHTETSLPDVGGLILPGGFSYGDYLRGGHLASISPVMKEVVRFAERGGAVLGICNGFQILTAVGLLPGTLLPNSHGQFICKSVPLQVCQSEQGAWGRGLARAQKTDITLPVAHGEGRYYCSDETLHSLQDNDQIVLRYKTDINGSVDRIAGVTSKSGNIFGLMPHPERAVYPTPGSDQDGKLILTTFLSTFL